MHDLNNPWWYRPWLVLADTESDAGSSPDCDRSADPGEPEAPKPAPPATDQDTDYWKRRSRENEAKAKANAAAAKRLEELENANKTEAQKAADDLAKAQQAEADALAEAARYKAAAAHGIDPDHVDLLGTGDEDEVMSRAERLGKLIADSRALAELRAAPEQGEDKTPASGRPVPKQWHPGATPVEVNAGPTAKDRGLAAAQRLGWAKPQ